MNLRISGLTPPWLEAVGVAVARLGTLVGSGLRVGGAFDEHGGVDEHLGDPGEAIGEAVVEKEIDGVGEGGIVVRLGHGWCLVRFRHLHYPTVAGLPQSPGGCAVR
jgi:hypothetical protein